MVVKDGLPGTTLKPHELSCLQTAAILYALFQNGGEVVNIDTARGVELADPPPW